VLNFIVVTGRREGKEIQLALMHRTRIHEVWDALVRAGAVPIGPPPLHRYEARPRLSGLAIPGRRAADQGIPPASSL
jgi:hypothetical protein